MRNAFHLLVVVALACAAAFAAAAQTTTDAADNTSGLDLEAIRERARMATEDAEALAAQARARAEALADEARASAGEASTHRQPYATEVTRAAAPDPAEPFDFDAMIAGAGDLATSDMGQAPRFVAFASTSMPPQALRRMIDDTARAGGVVVLRGLPQGSGKALTAALARIAREGERMDGVGIDPRLFRAFGIQAVPAYVVAASDFDLCDGFDCTTQVPPHDRISGNVTVGHALETFAQGGGPGARIAAQHLARLERSEQ